MVNFSTVFEKYGEGYKEAQVRDKFTEIVDAVGIEARLLRGGDKFNSPLEIPETSVDFIVDILKWHTSPEAKALRKAKFLEVSPETKAWLIDGFIDYLENRGYNSKVIEHQRQRMEHRMKCSLQRNLDKLSASLNEIHAHVCKLDRLQGAHFTDEDQILFADFANKKVRELTDYLDNVAAYLDDGRSEEIYEAALEDFHNSSDAEIMERELRQEQIYLSVSHDKRYKSLEKECDALIAEDDFVKKKKGRYQQILDEMQEIADSYEKEIFGDIMDDEPEPHFVFKHPVIALAEAIEYKKEVDEERKKMLERPPISEEQQEAIRQFFAEHGIDIDKKIADLEEGDDDDE